MIMRFKLFGRDSLWEKFFCGFAVSFFATTIFIYFAAQNASEFSLRTVGILFLIFLFISVFYYLVSLLILRRAFSAFIFCVVCWFVFYVSPFFFETFVAYIFSTINKSLYFTSIFIITIALIVTFITRKINKKLQTVYFFAAVTAVIFAINFSVLIRVFNDEASAKQVRVPLKKDFYVNQESKSPNIYWIHADGMLGVNAVKKYFDDDQKKFLSELSERGFVINPAANFEARHGTMYAIPALMNPYGYDKWIKKLIFADGVINEAVLNIARHNSEFQYAFSAKNYAVNLISSYGIHYYYPIKNAKLWATEIYGMKGQIFSHDYINNNFFFDARKFVNPFIERFLDKVVYRSTNFTGEKYKIQIDNNKLKKIFSYDVDILDVHLDFIHALYDILYGNYPSPKLTVIHDLTPHCPFIYDENGKIVRENITTNKNPLDYYPQHKWSAKVLINVIDMILDVDPDAVIVLQSDHGLHGNTEKDFKTAFGEKADAKELWNSTMSAIRVLEKFQTGEEHFAIENPLNISRYLVNNFVGKNYEYLSSDAGQ